MSMTQIGSTAATNAWDYRWSAKNGEYPNGDPDLHHFIGNLLAGGKLNLILTRGWAV